jgi:hypothetical protein
LRIPIESALAAGRNLRQNLIALPPMENADRSTLIAFADRASDSPVVQRVWRSHSEQAGVFHSIAGCHWGMVVARLEGKTSLFVRGPETKATLADCPPEGEWFGVLFKLGTFMPSLRSGDLRDRNDVRLPNATTHSFWLDGSAWNFPTFDNMDTFVNRLVRRGLILTDSTVEGVIRGERQSIGTRTEQRHLLRATGLTRGAIDQIERARRATRLLRHGMPVLDVVHEAGYYDQAHLTRSLQRFIGQTPGHIAQAKEQLSLLYNIEP